jgi:lipid-binding SYLF domain-containing protein
MSSYRKSRVAARFVANRQPFLTSNQLGRKTGVEPSVRVFGQRERVMKRLLVIAIATVCASLLLMGCSHKPAAAATPQGVDKQQTQVADRVDAAATDLQQLVNAPDAGIPQEIMAKAKCVAVIPDMVKGGFVFGAEHGRGLATCRTPNGWSAPAPITLTGGSWGAQIGVQSADVVLLFMNDHAVQSLLSDKVKLGADASIAAGPVGRHAQASTDVKLDAEILAYSRTKGLYAGLTLDGAKVSQDMDTTVAMYGRSIPFREILSGNVQTPAVAAKFVDTVRRDFAEAVAKE